MTAREFLSWFYFLLDHKQCDTMTHIQVFILLWGCVARKHEVQCGLFLVSQPQILRVTMLCCRLVFATEPVTRRDMGSLILRRAWGTRVLFLLFLIKSTPFFGPIFLKSIISSSTPNTVSNTKRCFLHTGLVTTFIQIRYH